MASATHKARRVTETGSPILAKTRSVLKDERNIAEYPLGWISERAPVDESGKELKTLEWTGWTRVGKKRQRARWLVTGSDEYGAPRGLDHEVLFVFIDLACQRGLKDPQISILAALPHLRDLGWSNSGQSYERLRMALRRWFGTSVFAQYALWNQSLGTYEKEQPFRILTYELTHKRLPSGRVVLCGWVKFEPELWNSMQAGNLNSLDPDIYRTMKTTLNKALYRYLDRKRKRTVNGVRLRWFYKDVYDLGALLGMAPTALAGYKPAKIRSLLEPGLGLLRDAGLIKTYTFRGERRATLAVNFAEVKKDLRRSEGLVRPGPENTHADQDRIAWLVDEIVEVTGDRERSERYYRLLVKELPPQEILELIAVTRDVKAQDPLKTDPAKLFTYLAQQRRADPGEASKPPRSGLAG